MIYADLLFFINLIADFIVLFAVSVFVCRKTSIFRIILSAAFAAFMYCISIIFMKGSFLIINLSMAISIYICFKPKNIRYFLKLVFYTLISAVLTGGIFSALYFAASNRRQIKFSLPVMLVSSIIIYISAKVIIYGKSKKQTICSIKITKGEKSIALRGLIDTGNTLCEPYTGKPVTVVCGEYINFMLGGCSFIYVPFKSIGRKNGVMKAFTADRIEIEKNIIENAVIGIADFKLDSEFEAVINPKIIK